MRQVYEDYRKEHPEELKEIDRLKSYTKAVDSLLRKRQKQKLKRIEECRRILYGNDNQ